jgi:hypothetical protein
VKKIVAIFFLVVYGFASIGATLHTHYCMGEYVGTTLVENKNSKCGKCGMKEDAKKKGCCKDEHKEFKLKVDQQKSSVANFVHAISSAILITPTPHYNFSLLKVDKFTYTNFYPPPNIKPIKLHVLYGVFLI